jgi:hypothetical protein
MPISPKVAGKRRGVANTPVEIYGSTKSSTRSIRALTGAEPVAATGEARLGRQPWKALRVIADENRAEVNSELVERLAESQQRDWTYFGRLRHVRRRSFEIRKMC